MGLYQTSSFQEPRAGARGAGGRWPPRPDSLRDRLTWSLQRPSCLSLLSAGCWEMGPDVLHGERWGFKNVNPEWGSRSHWMDSVTKCTGGGRGGSGVQRGTAPAGGRGWTKNQRETAWEEASQRSQKAQRAELGGPEDRPGRRLAVLGSIRQQIGADLGAETGGFS